MPMQLRLTRGARIALIVAGVVLVAIAAIGIYAYVWFQRDVPETFADIDDHFRYGSIGAEGRSGIPYWIWRVLPTVFPEHLPDGPGEGYERVGFIYEPDAPRRRPIGVSYRESPIPQIGLNCAVCHTGLVRDAPDAPPRIVSGMPAHQFDLQKYLGFLFAVGRDERFNAGTLIPAIRQANPEFSWLDSLFYRFFVIPRTKRGLIERAEEFAWLERRPTLGPGRVDTFNPYKVMLGLDLNANDDNTIGTADLPPLYRQRARAGLWLHWDANNDSVDERNLSAAIGAGSSNDSLDHPSIGRVAEWILDLPPPEFPRDKVDASRVEAGRALYEAHCARCHSLDGQETGQFTQIAQLGTDPERLNSFTPELARRMNTIGAGYPWAFSHFRKTDGYANMPLDGIWLRAPYLHNGSVPTMRDLLRPPDQRPRVFYRGYNVYDYANMGFVSSGPDAERSGFRFDTTVRGNGNGGHAYGTNLSEQEIQNLLEFLKTQ
jgi:mono/diheme cytochrome c family protein